MYIRRGYNLLLLSHLYVCTEEIWPTGQKHNPVSLKKIMLKVLLPFIFQMMKLDVRRLKKIADFTSKDFYLSLIVLMIKRYLYVSFYKRFFSLFLNLKKKKKFVKFTEFFLKYSTSLICQSLKTSTEE